MARRHEAGAKIDPIGRRLHLERMSFGERLNARAVLERRRDTGALTWAGLATMLFARSICAIVAQGLVAAVLAVRGSAAPWRDAAAWFPVYATLIDAGCLALFYMLMRREGARLVELLSFDRRRFGRDVLVGLLLSRQAGSSSWAGSRRRASWSTERRIRPRSLRPCCWGGGAVCDAGFPPRLGLRRADDLQRLPDAALRSSGAKLRRPCRARGLFLLVPARGDAGHVRRVVRALPDDRADPVLDLHHPGLSANPAFRAAGGRAWGHERRRRLHPTSYCRC